MDAVSSERGSLESLRSLFREFDAEPRPLLLEREQNTFDRLAHPWERSIVLAGAGPLGRIVADGLRRVGIEPIAFIDNNPKLWGTEVEGIKVFPPKQALEKFGASACFVVTIYNGATVRRQLQGLGCQKVLHFAPLFWKYPDTFIPGNGIDLPHRILDESKEIASAFSLLADEASRTEFLEQLEWRYSLDEKCLSPRLDDKNIYFPPDIVTPSPNDVFVDCGAFNGDSVRSFLTHRDNKFQHIVPFEPDPENRKALSKFVNENPELNGRVTIQPYAVANESTRLKFNVTNSAGSSIATGDTSFEVECRRLDDLRWDHAPTYIKMDIEGAEIDALTGATQLIRKNLPVLAICVYHRSEHLWEVPSLIRSISSEYSLFIRRYAEECWELVCYAVPSNRLVKNGN